MLNGFWTVTFHTNVDAGAGVITVRDGRVTGGDSAFTYIGSLTEGQNGSISGELQVKRHSNMGPGLIPGLDNYALTLSGNADDSQFTLSAAIKGQPHAQVTIKGKKVASS